MDISVKLPAQDWHEVFMSITTLVELISFPEVQKLDDVSDEALAGLMDMKISMKTLQLFSMTLMKQVMDFADMVSESLKDEILARKLSPEESTLLIAERMGLQFTQDEE